MSTDKPRERPRSSPPKPRRACGPASTPRVRQQGRGPAQAAARRPVRPRQLRRQPPAWRRARAARCATPTPARTRFLYVLEGRPTLVTTPASSSSSPACASASRPAPARLTTSSTSPTATSPCSRSATAPRRRGRLPGRRPRRHLRERPLALHPQRTARPTEPRAAQPARAAAPTPARGTRSRGHDPTQCPRPSRVRPRSSSAPRGRQPPARLEAVRPGSGRTASNCCEWERFEPSVEFPYTGLANLRLQPLGHHSMRSQVVSTPRSRGTRGASEPSWHRSPVARVQARAGYTPTEAATDVSL